MTGTLTRSRVSQTARVQARLAELRRLASEASASTMNELGAIVSRYKGTFADLSAQRASALHPLWRSNPTAAQRLDDDGSYKIYVPECAVFEIDGVTITYVPANDSSRRSDSPGDIREVEELVMPPTKEPQPVDLDSPAYGDAKAASKPPSHNTKTRRQIEIQTESPDIKMADVSRNSMWIFDYGSDPRHSLFVMKCPRNCQSPVFTKHPLMEERAASHLRRCRVPFRSEKDMIRRYARRVVSGRKGRDVTRSWARKHNFRLIPENEGYLHAENLSGE